MTMLDLDRRSILAMLGGAATLPLLAGRASAAAADNNFVMWRDPGCDCCLEWAKRMQTAFGRPLRIVSAPNMAAIKSARGVPAELRSCHTALVAGFSIEGHVPPADIKRLIASRDRTVRGLAVPGMPMGSPGMEHGSHSEPFQVFAFGPRGRRVFASH
jgi:hypothetical protein